MDTIDEKWVEPFQEEDFATLFQSDTFAGFGEEYELQSNNHVLQATPHAAPDAGFCFNDVVHSQPISPTIPPSANLVTDTPPAGNSASDNDTNPHLLANDRFDKVNNDEEDHAENEEEEKPGYTRKAAGNCLALHRKTFRFGQPPGQKANAKQRRRQQPSGKKPRMARASKTRSGLTARPVCKFVREGFGVRFPEESR